MLVDDDPEDRFFFTTVLSRFCTTECKMVYNGKQALELLSTWPDKPGCIFLDINMPIMNGYECLVEIKKRPELAGIPVIMYSTSDDMKTRETAMSLGAHAFLAKPFSLKVLEAELRKILSGIFSFSS